MSSQRTRRTFLRAAATAVTLPMINFGMYPAFAGTSKKYSRRVLELVGRSIVIDMLGVLKMDFTPGTWSARLPAAAAAEFRNSGVTAMHHSVGFVGANAHAEVLEFYAAWLGFVGRNSELFHVVDRVEDIERAKQAGKVAVIMGVQNADHFRTAEDVQAFHDLGQRCSQLTYNSQNLLGSGSTDRVDGGVSDYGAQIIQAMNRAGMLVDVSHCGDRTTLDAIELSTRPIAITHSNCRALNDHPRLKTDEAIRKLAGRGGVMGICGVRNFVRGQEPTSIEHLVDHIDHVVKLTGIEHVGIGSDTDLNGYDDMPAKQLEDMRSGFKASYGFRHKLDTDGFDDPLKFYDLADALVRRGYSDANIEAILGGNFRRLLGAVWSKHI